MTRPDNLSGCPREFVKTLCASWVDIGYLWNSMDIWANSVKFLENPCSDSFSKISELIHRWRLLATWIFYDLSMFVDIAERNCCVWMYLQLTFSWVQHHVLARGVRCQKEMPRDNMICSVRSMCDTKLDSILARLVCSNGINHHKPLHWCLSFCSCSVRRNHREGNTMKNK